MNGEGTAGVLQTVNDALGGEELTNASDFTAFLIENGMRFERGGGYWEDKIYWCVDHRGESVCYILLEDGAWTVWSDDSGINSYEGASLSEDMMKIAWSHLAICENDERCFDGCARKRKIFFGKEFDNVCGTSMKFRNPNGEEVECLKRLMMIRVDSITGGFHAVCSFPDAVKVMETVMELSKKLKT